MKHVVIDYTVLYEHEPHDEKLVKEDWPAYLNVFLHGINTAEYLPLIIGYVELDRATNTDHLYVKVVMPEENHMAEESILQQSVSAQMNVLGDIDERIHEEVIYLPRDSDPRSDVVIARIDSIMAYTRAVDPLRADSETDTVN